MVMVGLLTLVSICVGSVTSTCLRSSFGDMTVFSAPRSPVSSGTLPGQSSMTSGLSAAPAGQATHNQVSRQTVQVQRIGIAPLLREVGSGRTRLRTKHACVNQGK